MKKIIDIYEEYKIMPILQLHQLRVAAVACIICEHATVSVDKDSIIKACLIHDMANIVKFILGSIPGSVEDKGLEYWQNVQKEYISKYGNDEHTATFTIAQELGMDNNVCELINSIGFHTAKENLESEDFNRKICAYADMRVTPYGVDTLLNRLQNLKERYHGRNKTSNLDLGYEKDSLEENIIARELFENSLKKIEIQIFKNCNLNPEDIMDEVVKSVVEKLKDYKI